MKTQAEIAQHYAQRRRKQRERLTDEELQKRCEVFIDRLLAASEKHQSKATHENTMEKQ